MKVAKCCESKEPELLTFEQIKDIEGIYTPVDTCAPGCRVIVIEAGIPPIYLSMDRDYVTLARFDDGGEFLRTSETLCVGLKDANGKWVE